MTQTTARRLRRLASPSRQDTASGSRRRATALLLRLACAALLAWIGYIHLHLWLEGYRQIPTDGPLFLADAVAGFASPPRSWPGRGRWPGWRPPATPPPTSVPCSSASP